MTRCQHDGREVCFRWPIGCADKEWTHYRVRCLRCGEVRLIPVRVGGCEPLGPRADEIPAAAGQRPRRNS